MNGYWSHTRQYLGRVERDYIGSFSIDEGDSGENVTFKGEQMDKWIARETQRWTDVRMID